MIFKRQGTENSRIDNSSNWIVNNNLTVSGALQSFQTSLLATSSSVMDAKLGTIIGVSIPQFLTRNETTLPSSFVSSSLTSLGRQTNPLNITNNIDCIGTFNLSVSGNKIISLSGTTLAVNPNSSVSVTGICYHNGPVSSNIYYSQNISGQPLFTTNITWIGSKSYIPLQVLQPIMSSTTQFEDPQPVLQLGRPAKSFDTYAGSMIFNICKYDNSVGSINRLDTNIDYCNSSGTAFYPTLMSIRGDGNIGIGITNPTANLDIEPYW